MCALLSLKGRVGGCADGKQIFDSSSTGLPLWCVCRVRGLNYTGVVSALQCPVLRPLRGRAAVIGFSMKDHKQLPGGSVDCSVALLHQSSVFRL